MRKIMFNDKYGLEKSVFKGNKKKTRRTVPDAVLKKVDEYIEEYREQALDDISVEEAILNMVGPEHMFNCAYHVGEIVAIAQSYSTIEKEIDRLGLPLNMKESVRKSAGFNNKMFVKAEDMPHHICVTDVKVERLKDISEEDCIAEGILPAKLDYTPGGYKQGLTYYTFANAINKGKQLYWNYAYDAFRNLIDRLSGKGSFESNPYVFVYTFELVD